MKTEERAWGKVALVAAVCVAFVVLEWLLEHQMPAGAVAIKTAMPPAETKGLDIVLSLNSTFLTYGVALFGGIGFYLKGVLKKEFDLTTVEWRFLVVSGVMALLSIFFGHLVPFFSFAMLANQMLDLQAGALQWPMRLQYLSLALSASMFLAAALSAAGRTRKVAAQREKSDPVME